MMLQGINKLLQHSSSSCLKSFIILFNISFCLLMTMAKFANNNQSNLLYYYNSNSEHFISCSFNPLCYCKYDERTEIYETVVRLWFMAKFNSTEYYLAIINLINRLNDEPDTIYHLNSAEILTLANRLTNSTTTTTTTTKTNINNVVHSIRLNHLFEYGPVFDIDCDKVPITQIPTEYNVQGLISHVSVTGAKLLILDSSTFAGLEIQGIRLTNNQLYFISEFAFSSMSNALTMLDLSSNSLDGIPFAAFKTFNVLEWLNLSNNLINTIFGDWYNVANSMRKLILSGNSINSLPSKILTKFERLSWLDLSSNYILNFTQDSLPPNIQTLNLMKNRINHIPTHIFDLKSLSWLYLSGCSIEKIPIGWAHGSQYMQMNQIDLSDNFIHIWPTKPFGCKLSVLDLNLNQNYIEIIPPLAFFSMNIFRLSFGHNAIHTIDPSAFSSLESTLKYLNLENNKLESIPWNSIKNLTSLIHLYLGSNHIDNVGLEHPEGLIDCKLTYLGLNGNQLNQIPNKILTHCLHLFHLNLGYNQITHLDDLAHIMFRGKRLRNLHTLILRSNPIHSLVFIHRRNQHNALPIVQRKSNNTPIFPFELPTATATTKVTNAIYSTEDPTITFKTVSTFKTSEPKTIPNIFASELLPNLRELSLSFCELYGELEPFPFLPLTTLEISMGLKTATVLRPTTFSSLRQLEWLALDHNNLQSVTAFVFYSNPKLNYVNLEWNRIETLPPQLFHPDIHHSMAQLRLSHNKISIIESHSFISFSAINLDLSYNLINTIEREAFTELARTTNSHHYHHHHHYQEPQQQQLVPDSQQLRGNVDSTGRKSSTSSAGINNILDPIESILNQYDSLDGVKLYLSNNQLTKLKPNIFTSAKFSLIDLSQNNIISFNFDSIGPNTIVGSLNLSSNIIEQIWVTQNHKYWLKSLDLSHNRIKLINLSNICITNELDLSYNQIETINATYFPANCSVKELRLNHNFITNLDSGSFSNLHELTVLHINRNQLSLFPPVTLIRNNKLIYLDLSHNQFRSLPKDSFVGSSLENLNLSWNRFGSLPVSALSQISRHLKILDMSSNSIEHLDSTMFESISSLLHLNLSLNRLNSLPDSAFSNLASLRELDLSHNQLRANFKELFHFLPKLKVLKLSDCGIRVFPLLPLSHLISLDLSSNGLHELKIQNMGSLNKLRELDLSNNKLVNPKIPSWAPLYTLSVLKLSRNPLKSLTRDTFVGLTRLQDLELLEMGNIDRFDSDVFSKLSSLRSLSVETYPNIEKYRFRLGAVLSPLIHLEELHVIVKESSLSDQLNGGIHPKLRKLRITGQNLNKIEPIAFEGIQNNFQIDLAITHTSITEIPQRIFYLLQSLVWAKLDLSFNKLSTLDSALLYPNKSMWYTKGTKLLEGGLILNGNEFICDCDLVWLGEWIRRWFRESFQSHSIENIQLLHLTYKELKKSTCKDYKGSIVPIVELYSDTMCHASALSSATTTIHDSSDVLAILLGIFSSLLVLVSLILNANILNNTNESFTV